MQAVIDRSDRENDLVAAGEVLELRFRDGGRALSLRASKLFNLLIKEAGAKATEDIEHSVPIAELNFPHLERDELVECVRDLVGTTVELRVKAENGRDEIMIDPLLHGVRRPAHIDEEAGILYFRLSATLRRVLAQSNHWAVLSRKAILAFESRYSLRLHEIIAIRAGLDKKHSETFSLEDLRIRLGVPRGTFKVWNDLRRFVLDRAVGEVNQLSAFKVSYEPVKKGKSFVAVRFEWEMHSTEGRAAVARELEASRVGRKARREGKVEKIVDEPAEGGTTGLQSPAPGLAKQPWMRVFPINGSIHIDKWGDVVRKYAPDPTPDVDIVAAAFRRSCERNGDRLDAGNVYEHFVSFCKKWKS